ncbi:MAG: acireductone synthase [Caulobacteraceae bacterium]
MIHLAGVRAIVTDIEGTTSSIAFVHETLFPYARAHLAKFVARHPERVAPVLDAVRATEGVTEEAAVVATMLAWIDEDRKAPPLKALQGMIWREGYEAGELTAHVYGDVVPALRRWRAAGLALWVYSSGSVEAQKLLFGHSAAGDITPLLDGYFDTGAGSKTDPASYRRIATALGLEPGAILFLTDAPAEIAAARSADMQAVRLVREGALEVGEAASFAEIEVETG